MAEGLRQPRLHLFTNPKRRDVLISMADVSQSELAKMIPQWVVRWYPSHPSRWRPSQPQNARSAS